MSNDDGTARPEPLRVRKEPPPLVPVTVTRRRERSHRLLRLTLEGAGIHTMASEAAASVRLLVPSPGTTELVMPEWNGNEFLLPDGERPALRTFTPLSSGHADQLDLEIVRHAGGVVSTWAEQCEAGATAALSGPGRGYEIDPDATTFHLFGDETALPAVGQLIERLPLAAVVDCHVEVVDKAAIVDLPEHPNATITWHITGPGIGPGAKLVGAAGEIAALAPSELVWAAGEAATVQAIRNHLFKEIGVPRSQATIRGYWKPARD